jgi:predicted  nucleic acid-binding Zn-ribbon protein
LSGEHKADLEAIKAHIANWKTLGKVPFNRRHIEGKFNKILDALFEKLSLSKKDTEMMRFSNRLEQLNENDDKRALEQEQFFIRKKIDEVQGEIFQLENNIQFISSSSKGENPFIKEVQKSIERHKDELKLWKEKLQQIKNM